MSRYLCDGELGWVRRFLREEAQAHAVGQAIADFEVALYALTMPDPPHELQRAERWSCIVRGLSNPEPGSIVRVE